MRWIATAVAAAALALPAAAPADEGVSGFDGTNPFDCTLQQLGTGADFPQPDADPFCVEYDKRHQNVTELGVVEFLSLEPARTAAASPKCFYFQRDHWVGSVVQDDGRTETYAWDGSYFFDKARATGGVYVENVSFNGQSGDPTAVPGFPAEYRPFFGAGRGGAQRTGDVPADPSCVAKAAERSPYRRDAPGRGGYEGAESCRVPGGRVDRGIGGVRLGMTRARAREALGPPTAESAKLATWCMVGGGRLTAAFGRRGDAGRAVLVVTDSPPFDAAGVRTGTPKRKAHRRLHGERAVARGVLGVARRRDVLVVGLARGRVAYLASAARSLGPRRTLRFLRSAGR